MSGQPKMWFSYSGSDGNGFSFWETKAEAKKAAENALDYSRDHASDDGWGEDDESICWGKIKQRATILNVRETPGGQWDEIHDMELMP